MERFDVVCKGNMRMDGFMLLCKAVYIPDGSHENGWVHVITGIDLLSLENVRIDGFTLFWKFNMRLEYTCVYFKYLEVKVILLILFSL